MSVSSLTTIAAARERAHSRLSKGQVGVVPVAEPGADDDASVTDVLAKQIPVELIAPYTALTAAIVGAVAKPTSADPTPDQLSGWRWAAFAVLIASVILVVWWGKYQKTKTWTFPWVAAVAAVASAIAWAFLMPGSPLVPYIHGETASTLIPLFLAVVGVVVAAGTAALLVMPPRADVRSPEPPADQ